MKHTLTLKQEMRFWKFIFMDDFEFYDIYIAKLTEEAQMQFLQDTPGFLPHVTGESDNIDLTTDRIYQRLMKQIHDLEPLSVF